MAQQSWLTWHHIVIAAMIITLLFSGVFFGMSKQVVKKRAIRFRDRLVKRPGYDSSKLELSKMTTDNVKRRLAKTKTEYKASAVNIQITRKVIALFKREIWRADFAQLKRKLRFLSSPKSELEVWYFRYKTDNHVRDTNVLRKELKRHVTKLREKNGDHEILGEIRANTERYLRESK